MKRIVLIAVAVLIVAACGQPSSKNEVSVSSFTAEPIEINI